MKTITQKNAFKLFFSLFLLFSANAFSFTKLPNEASSSGSGSRIGYVARTTNMPKINPTTYAAKSKGKAMKSKNIALRSNVGPRISL
jgi:hypothetical protein